MKKHSIVVVTAAATVGGAVLAIGAVPVHAGTAQTIAKWRNCDSREAAISVRGTFTNPAAYYGKGRYMVKKWIEWEKYDAGRWLERDRNYTETNWLTINNTGYDFVSTAGDRTNWAALYYNHWRAKVTIKLIKNRPGPRDKNVETIELFPTKGSFPEKGSDCGVGF